MKGKTKVVTPGRAIKKSDESMIERFLRATRSRMTKPQEMRLTGGKEMKAEKTKKTEMVMPQGV